MESNEDGSLIILSDNMGQISSISGCDINDGIKTGLESQLFMQGFKFMDQVVIASRHID